MTSQEPLAALAALARRLRDDPRFMSYVLAAYQEQEGLTDDDFAREIGTLPALVSRLALCKRPDSSSARFAEQVRELADYALIDEARLAGILRQVEALEKLARRPADLSARRLGKRPGYSPTGLLAAARDCNEKSPDDTLHEDERPDSEE